MLLLGGCSVTESSSELAARSVSPAHAPAISVLAATESTDTTFADDPAAVSSNLNLGTDPTELSTPMPSDPGSAPLAPLDALSAPTRARIAAIKAKVGDDDPTPVPILARPKAFSHRLAPRETIDQVAYRYGIPIEKLRESNGIGPDVQRLRLGSRLKVRTRRVPPRRERIVYEVVDGDTWWSVVLRHGVDARDVRAYNYPTRGKMSPGSRLQIWIDPLVYGWILAGGDPLPDDEAFVLRRGSVSVGTPDSGRLINGVRIPKGDGYRLRLPKSSYGSSHGVAQILIGLEVFREISGYNGELEIGAMSRPRGGALGTHKSHTSGRDLDIRLPRREGVSRYAELTRRRIDWVATWHLIVAMLTADVRVIFLDYATQRRLYKSAKAAGIDPRALAAVLQYPHGSGRAGRVRHSDGHDQHMHVRVGCGPYELECVE